MKLAKSLKKPLNIFSMSRGMVRYHSITPIPVILHPSWLGQKRIGVALSPYIIRAEFQKLQYLRNYYNLCPNDTDLLQINLLDSEAKNKDLMDDLINLYDKNNSVKGPRINIGGDHSMSIATLAYTLNLHPNAKVLWIDAHPDINTYHLRLRTSMVYHSILSQLDIYLIVGFRFCKID